MLRSIDKNLIVQETEDENYIQNGIIIKSNGSRNILGNVISVGNNVVDIYVGDTIIFSKDNARTLVYENNEYLVINENDVLAVI